MRNLKLFPAVLLIVSGLLLLFTTTAIGADEGIELSPPMKDLSVDPGSEQTFEVTLDNPSHSKTQNIQVSISPIVQKRNGSYSLTAENGPFSAVSWLEVRTIKNPLTLLPKNSATVTVKVKVPRNAYGSRSAAIVFEVVSDEKKANTQGIGGSTTFRHRLTTIVKITVNSRANRKLASIQNISVLDNATDKRFGTYGKKAISVICTVSNDGNTILAANGYLIIRNPSGRRVKEVPLGSGRGIILPGTSVELVSIFPGGLPDGEYTVETTIPFGGPRPLIAKIPFTISRNQIQKGASEIPDIVRLNVSPERFETQLPGGAFRTFALSIVNDEKYRLKVRGLVKNVMIGTDGELAPADEATPVYSAIPWLNLEPSDLVLEPGERKILRIKAAIPKGTTDGTRYATMVLEVQKSDAQETGIVTSISTPLVITVGKNLERKAVLENLKVYQDKSGIWVFGGQLQNQGNTHFAFSGKLILRRNTVKLGKSNGLEILSKARWEDHAVVELADSGWLLPGDVRSVFAVYDKKLPIGEYQAEIMVDYGEKIPVNAHCIFKLTPK